MPFGGLLVAAGAGAVLGGVLPGAAGAGNNTFRASDYTDSDKYNKGAFDLDPQARAQALATGGMYANRQAIQGDYGMANQARLAQQNAIGMQRQAALGLTPSVAEQQMGMGNAQAMRNQLAMQANARGAGAMGVAQANAAQNMANLQSQNIANSGVLRAQEMAAARDAYLQGTTGMRGQDIGQANANLQAALQSRGQNDAMNQFYNQQAQQDLMANYQGQMAREQFQADQHQAADALNMGVNQRNADNQWKYWQGAMGGAMGGMQMGSMLGAGQGGAGGGMGA